MPRRTKRVPSKYSIDLPLPTVQHSIGAHHLLVAFLKHLVFAREQCHAPFADLQRYAQACQQLQQQQQQPGRRRRLKSTSRKALKYHDKLCSLLQLAGNIPFLDLPGTAVTVMLGPSVLRPREVYTLQFPAASYDQAGTGPPSDKQLSEASRKFLRALIMQHGNIVEWDTAPGPTKMFLLFSAPEGSLLEVPQGFLARRGFRLNLSKAFQVNINLGFARPIISDAVDMDCDDQHVGRYQQQQQAAAGDADDQVEQLSQRMSTQMLITETVLHPAEAPSLLAEVWYQCVVHIKGLKSTSPA